MLRALFARLTAEPKRGQPLFELAVAEARRPHWFVDGGVPDTVEGRFAVLATVLALVTVRLEQAGDAGESASVALTERFVEEMDGGVREMGVGDPGLGKQVRRLVGALAHRVGLWRAALGAPADWSKAAGRSLYGAPPASAESLDHSGAAGRSLSSPLARASIEELCEGAVR